MKLRAILIIDGKEQWFTVKMSTQVLKKKTVKIDNVLYRVEKFVPEVGVLYLKKEKGGRK